ncbi:MAG: ArnT family glycosyltransferase [Ramlibacter sp.]
MKTVLRQMPPALWVLLLVMLPASLVLYGSTVNGWWCCDDSQLLKSAIKYSPWQYFAVPDVWREIVNSTLSPLDVLAYDIDLALFGTRAWAFYAHNLLSIALTAWTVYLVTRQWTDRAGPAVAAGLLFLTGSPVAISSEQLMGRHYIEGMAAYLLALWLFVRAAREQRPGLAAWAGLAYAVSATAKEIFLPLGLVPFLLPVGPLRVRAWLGWPFLLVMALYIPWRTYMLGHALGGYQPAGSWLSLQTLQIVGQQLRGVPGWMLTPWGVATGAAALGLGAWLIPSRRRLAVLLAAGLVLGLLLLPLLALARHPGLNVHRYFLTLWTAFAIVVPLGLARLGTHEKWGWRAVAPGIFLVLAADAWGVTSRTVDSWRVLAREQATQGKALVAPGADHTVIYLTPVAAGWSASGLIDLRAAMGVTGTPPLMVADEIELAGLPLAGKRVLKYSRELDQMVDVTPQVPALLAQWRTRLAAAPLSVAFEYDHTHHTITWQVGAAGASRLTYLGSYLGQIGRVELPMKSAMRIPPSHVDTCFRLRLDWPDGRMAYTPALSFGPADANARSRLSWHGMSAPEAAAQPGCAIQATR